MMFLKVLFISTYLVVFISFVSAQTHLNEINDEICYSLNKRVDYAEYSENLIRLITERLRENQIKISKDQPGFDLFKGLKFSPTLVETCFNADISTKLSRYLMQYLFAEMKPRLYDINPLLKRYSSCVRDFFNQNCVKSSDILCPTKSYYASIDGQCRNPRNPKQGAAETLYSSMVFPVYEDSVSSIRKTFLNRENLPNSRMIVRRLFDRCTPNITNRDYTVNLAGIMFAQMITHDISFKPSTQLPEGGDGIACCMKDGLDILPHNLSHPLCNPITVSSDDQLFKRFGVKCMNFIRTQSAIDNQCSLSSRRQLNLVTSSLDLSNIYGLSLTQLQVLRTFEGGTLRVSDKGTFFRNGTEYVFADSRTNQTPILAVFHSLFIREHNRIAKSIQKLLPHLEDEVLFYEARRFTIAVYQHIIYNEWLPIFLGPLPTRSLFNQHIDVSTTNDFAHSAFRHLHTSLPEHFNFYNETGSEVLRLNISDTINNIEHLETQYDNVCRGLFYQNIENNGCHNEIMNKLFKNKKGLGVDLLSIDIERSRDHGVAPYYVYAQICLNKIIYDFDDLEPEISPESIQKLKAVYSSVYDIDLYVAAEFEKKVNAFFGPTITCITLEQFFRYRHGDTYFFDNPNNPYPFTKTQLSQIKRASFARLICDNTRIKNIPVHAFLSITQNDNRNRLLTCSDVLRFEISL